MIGIDISSRSIKVVEINGEDMQELRTLCWSELEFGAIRRGIVQQVDVVAAALERTMRSCLPATPKGKNVVASIPESQSYVRVLELPRMAESEIDEAVQWAIKRHLPFDLERVYLDWEILPSLPKAKHYQVLVGAAQRSVVDPLLRVLDTLGLNVLALELEAQAVTRCLLPQAGGDGAEIRGVLIADLGATSTNVVFYDQGAMRYTASLQSGGDDLSQSLAAALGVLPTEAIEMKAQIDLASGSNDKATQILRAAAIRLTDKVRGVVQEMSAQLPAERRVRAILLSGGGANLKGIGDVFAAAFPGVSIQMGNPLVNLQQDSKSLGVKLSMADAFHFTTAIGLALRPADIF